MNALGGSKLERTICASAGIAGVLATHGVSPEVDPELWPRARYVILWGWNPMSTAPHLWRKLLDARRAGAKLVVIDPFRSRTARVADDPPAPAARDRRRARARDDAGGPRRGPRRRGVVPRARRGLRRAAGRLGEHSVERVARALRRRRRGGRAPGRDRVRPHAAGAAAAGVGAQRHAGAPIAYRTVACLPALVGAWRHPVAAARTSPRRRRRPSARRPPGRRAACERPCARSTCRSSARR